MVPLRIKVAHRFRLANGLDRGNSFSNPKVSIRRMSDQLVVTDLTNAGKRGKKVPQFWTSTTYNYTGDAQAWLFRISQGFLDFVNAADPYSKMLGFVKDVSHDFPGDIKITEESLRGVDVEPYGAIFEFDINLQDGKSEIRVKCSPHDFSVVDHHWYIPPNRDQAMADRPGLRLVKAEERGFYLDTRYTPDKKTDAVVFYKWVSENLPKVQAFKGMEDFREIWKRLGVRFDSH